MFIIGTCVYFFIIIVITTLFGAQFHSIIDLPSLAFVVFSNIAILVSTKSIHDFWYGVKLVTLKNVEVDSCKLIESIKIFKLLQKSSIGISVVGCLIGTIRILHSLTEPSSIGQSVAAVLIIVFYSTILSLMVLSPARYILSKIERKTNKSINTI